MVNGDPLLHSSDGSASELEKTLKTNTKSAFLLTVAGVALFATLLIILFVSKAETNSSVSRATIDELVVLANGPEHHAASPERYERLRQFLRIQAILLVVKKEIGVEAHLKLRDEFISDLGLTAAERMSFESVSRDASPELPQDDLLAELYGPAIGVEGFSEEDIRERRGQAIYEAAIDRMLDRVERTEGEAARLGIENQLRRGFHENRPMESIVVEDDIVIPAEEPPVEVQIINLPTAEPAEPVERRIIMEPRERVEHDIVEPNQPRGDLGFSREEKMIREIKEAIDRAGLD